MNMIDYVFSSPEFNAILDSIFNTVPMQTYVKNSYVKNSTPTYVSRIVNQHKYFPTLAEIPISRVTYSGNKTIVWFTDGTRCVVTCSSNDKYDRQTAIAYALIKRIFGKIGRYDENKKKFIENEIDGAGIGMKLEKIAASGYDQDLENKNMKAKKAAIKAKHEATQKAQHEAAWKRKVQKRAEEMQLERDATALLDSLTKTKDKKIINESTNESLPKNDNLNDILETYQKPNKPFSKFTQKEKREYWRFHKAKKR